MVEERKGLTFVVEKSSRKWVGRNSGRFPLQPTGLIFCSSGDDDPSPLHSQRKYNGVLGRPTSLLSRKPHTTPDGFRDAESVVRKKREKINSLMEQVEATRFPFRKKLLLDNMNLTVDDIPLQHLFGNSVLWTSLHTLSLAGNNQFGVMSLPSELVQSFPDLKQLNLSNCGLRLLPEHWNLPKLAWIDLSHNNLTEFLEEAMLQGIPELQTLNMSDNRLSEVIVPVNLTLLSRLETLDLCCNDLTFLPDNLDQLHGLRFLKLRNNFLTKIPRCVCEMRLRMIDVTYNPVLEPPVGICGSEISSMRRYWQKVHNEALVQEPTEKASKEIEKVELTRSNDSPEPPSKTNRNAAIPTSTAKTKPNLSESHHASPGSHLLEDVVGKPSFKGRAIDRTPYITKHPTNTETSSTRDYAANIPEQKLPRDFLPHFKDQVCDRPRFPRNETSNPNTASTPDDKAPLPDFKDQARDVVPVALCPPAIQNDPSIVFADACLLNATIQAENALPTQLLDVESSLGEQIKKELANKDAEIERLKARIAEMSRTLHEAQLKDTQSSGKQDDNINSARTLPSEILKLQKQFEAMSKVASEAERKTERKTASKSTGNLKGDKADTSE